MCTLGFFPFLGGKFPPRITPFRWRARSLSHPQGRQLAGFRSPLTAADLQLRARPDHPPLHAPASLPASLPPSPSTKLPTGEGGVASFKPRPPNPTQPVRERKRSKPHPLSPLLLSVGPAGCPLSLSCSRLAPSLPRQPPPAGEGESRQTGRRVCWPLSYAGLGGGGGNWGRGGWRITGAEAGGAASLFREPSPLPVPQLVRLCPCRSSPAPTTARAAEEKRPAAAAAAASSPTRQPWKTRTSRLGSPRPRTTRPGLSPRSSTSS